MDENQTVKVIMTWDINPEHEREYFEFVMGELISGFQHIGLQPIEAWITLYGTYPQVQVVMLARDYNQAHQVLDSTGWSHLKEKLLNLITNFTCKVIPARNGFQF